MLLLARAHTFSGYKSVRFAIRVNIGARSTASAGRCMPLSDSTRFIEVVGIEPLHAVRGRCIYGQVEVDHQFREPVAVDEDNLWIDVVDVSGRLCREAK